MKCPRCETDGLQRITEELARDQSFWCVTCHAWITHKFVEDRLHVEFADWRCK